MIRKVGGSPFISFKTLSDESGCSLRPHSHPELSVGLVSESSTRVTVEGLDFSLSKGDLILIPAEQVHLCRPEDADAFRFNMVYFDAGWVKKTTGFPAGSIRPAGFRCPADWLRLFSDLAGESGESEHYLIDRLSGLLKALLAKNAESEPAAGTSPREQTAESSALGMDDVRRRITETPQQELRVDDMASLAGMSKYDFLRKYTRRYGQTPHASVTDQRIRRSLELMAEGLELTNIALDCGFSDQSHFNRQFKLYTGMKPSEYRKAILSN